MLHQVPQEQAHNTHAHRSSLHKQVNHAPSFSCGSPLDLKIKLELLRNTMRLIHLQAYHKKKFKLEQQQGQIQPRLDSLNLCDHRTAASGPG